MRVTLFQNESDFEEFEKGLYLSYEFSVDGLGGEWEVVNFPGGFNMSCQFAGVDYTVITSMVSRLRSNLHEEGTMVHIQITRGVWQALWTEDEDLKNSIHIVASNKVDSGNMLEWIEKTIIKDFSSISDQLQFEYDEELIKYFAANRGKPDEYRTIMDLLNSRLMLLAEGEPIEYLIDTENIRQNMSHPVVDHDLSDFEFPDGHPLKIDPVDIIDLVDNLQSLCHQKAKGKAEAKATEVELINQKLWESEVIEEAAMFLNLGETLAPAINGSELGEHFEGARNVNEHIKSMYEYLTKNVAPGA
jgi:hypothetical protein